MEKSETTQILKDAVMQRQAMLDCMRDGGMITAKAYKMQASELANEWRELSKNEEKKAIEKWRKERHEGGEQLEMF